MIHSNTLWHGIIVVTLIVLGGGLSSAQALELSVRGDSEIRTDIHAAGTTLYVGGRLQDDLGDALPGRGLLIEVRRRGDSVFSERSYTGYFGEFSAVVELPPGHYEAEVSYEGTSHVSGASAVESVEVVTAPTVLRLDAPTWVHGADGEVPVQIHATADGRGLPTFASLFVGGRPLTSLDLDGEGRASYDVGPYLAGGTNEVTVEIAANEFREVVTASREIRRVDDPVVDGHLGRVFLRLVRGVEVGVELRDSSGPVVGVDVEIRLERSVDAPNFDIAEIDELVEIAQTGRDGVATVVFRDEDLGGNSWFASARIVPPVGESLRWEGGEVRTEPSPWGRPVRTLALVVLAAGLLWLGRRGVLILWARIRRWMARRDDDPGETSEAQAPVLEPVEQTELEPINTAEKRRPSDVNQLGVQLWDEWRERPVVDGFVAIIGGEGEEILHAEDGVVELPALDAGIWKIRAEAPGFVAAYAKLEIPVRTDRVRMTLTAVPLKIRRAYRWMVEQTSGEDPWGRLTPRQIRGALHELNDVSREPLEDYLREEVDWRRLLETWEDAEESQRVEILLQVITAAVEETNFSGRDYDRDDWQATREVMQALVDSLAKNTEDM